MRRQLLTLTLLAAATLAPPTGGCARRQQATLGPVPANGFVRHWGADFQLKRDEADRLFLRDDFVFLYTRNNVVYTLSAAGGQLLAMNQVAAPRSDVRSPVLLGDKIVFPTLATMEVYDRSGRRIASVELDRPTRGPAVAQGNFLYMGVDHGRGGRLVKFDITRPFGKTLWELMTFAAISAAPAVYEDVVYAASEDGRLYAVNAARDPVWPIEGNTFVTAGRIVADVKVDDFGVYVASMDSKLYCLDRSTGRIKWTYYGAAPLREAPVALADRVYQYVPRRGLVAINKTEGQITRDALWVAPAARRFLSADGENVYVLTSQGSIAALDRNTGEPKFRSRRSDFAVTAQNTRDSTIYAATRDGQVYAIRPVLRPGTVGEIVFEERLLGEPLASMAGR